MRNPERASHRLLASALLPFAAALAAAPALAPCPLAHASPPPAYLYRSHLDNEHSALEQYPKWVSLGGSLGADPRRMRSFELGVGWQFAWLGVDLGFSLGSMSYGAISVSPSPTDVDNSSAATDPSAERARPRSASDGWSYWLAEPGVSATGRLFASSLPQWSERGRFGLGYGGMSDQANQLGFSAVIFSFEGDIDFQLRPGGRWFVRGGLAYKGGVLVNQASGGSAGRLPASWVEERLSVVYSF